MPNIGFNSTILDMFYERRMVKFLHRYCYWDSGRDVINYQNQGVKKHHFELYVVLKTKHRFSIRHRILAAVGLLECWEKMVCMFYPNAYKEKYANRQYLIAQDIERCIEKGYFCKKTNDSIFPSGEGYKIYNNYLYFFQKNTEEHSSLWLVSSGIFIGYALAVLSKHLG